MKRKTPRAVMAWAIRTPGRKYDMLDFDADDAACTRELIPRWNRQSGYRHVQVRVEIREIAQRKRT